MRVGWFTAVHVKSSKSQELRLLLTNRKALLNAQLNLENEVRGTLKAFGLKAGTLKAAGFEKRILELISDRPTLLQFVRPILVARNELRRQVAALHGLVLKACRQDPVCQRLMTAPGVGPIVALTYATAIDDPDRFRKSRDVGPHLGLTPRKYASGEIDRNGAINKAGDQMARQALFTAAIGLITRAHRWSPLKAWGMALAKRRGIKRATVAVARKLAVLLHKLWRDEVDFRWDKVATSQPP